MANHENSGITWLGLLTRPKACPFADGEIQGIRSKQEIRNINLRNRDSPNRWETGIGGSGLMLQGLGLTAGCAYVARKKNCPRAGLRINGQQYVDVGLEIFWLSFPKLMAALG